MYSETIILELVDLIYRAAGDPAGWSKLLCRLGEALGSNGCTIHHHQIPSQESDFSADWNVDPAAIFEYTAYYRSRNIFRRVRPHLFFTGSVNSSQALCPEDVFLRSEYYNDYLRRYKFYHALAATLRRDNTALSNLTIFRAKNDESFGDSEIRLLSLVAPHMVRAFQLHNQIRGLEKKASVLEETLNHLQSAVILLDARGVVLFVNRAAASLFQSQQYVRLSPAGIQAARTSEHKQLARLIRGAAGTGTKVDVSPGGIMKISRNGLQRPLHVLVSPLRTEILDVGKAMPAVIVFIRDPDLVPRMPAEWLRQLYGLTPAESRLAQLLASGSGLKEAAEQLQVSRSTVRSQLKSIFAKTDSNRQSALIRLLLTTPAQLFPGATKTPGGDSG